jgi:hypothetical protein
MRHLLQRQWFHPGSRRRLSADIRIRGPERNQDSPRTVLYLTLPITDNDYRRKTMKIGIIPRAALISATLLGFALPCPASETPAGAQDSIQKVQPEEAIVIRIDQNKVTLQSATDTAKTSTMTASDAADLKVGDRVTVVGATLKKSDSAPSSGAKTDVPPSASTSSTSQNKL